MPKKPATSSVELRYPQQYVFSCMSNRFAVEPEDGFTLVHFGLVNRSGLLLDRFTCVFPEYTLRTQRENLVQYSDRIGPPKKSIPAWSPPVREASDLLTVPVIDFLHLCHWDDAHAEICFWNYSQAHTADVVRTSNKGSMAPWGVVMLRCEIDLQRAFLVELYKDRS